MRRVALCYTPLPAHVFRAVGVEPEKWGRTKDALIGEDEHNILWGKMGTCSVQKYIAPYNLPPDWDFDKLTWTVLLSRTGDFDKLTGRRPR